MAKKDDVLTEDKVVEEIHTIHDAFNAHVDCVAQAIKKLIDSGCGAAVAAETAVKMWLTHLGSSSTD